MISFKLLGTLEVMKGDSAVTPTAPRMLNTLALLLVRANHVVPVDTIVRELWGESPPRSAATTAQTYIYQLRRWMDDEGLAVDGKSPLITRAPGYALEVAPGQIDLTDFEKLLGAGQTLMRDGRAEDAAVKLRGALDLWSGPPLANVQLGQVLEGHSAALEEHRYRALDLRIEADIRLGHYRELIGELRTLVAMQPYHEWYHSVLVSALACVGRRHDALNAYQQARRILCEDLGLSPSPELCRIRDAVLDGAENPLPESITETKGRV
jgi:DNA-binding SARP family transcriptional activator